MAQGFMTVMGNCHWVPAEMFMLLPLSELTYKGNLKKIFKDWLLFYGTFLVWKTIFAIFDLVTRFFCNWFEWMNTGFFTLQCSCSLSPVCTHQTRGRDASLLTCPCVSTMMRSQPRTVCRRWAIVNIVQSANASLMVSWISKSVSVSIAAVASSRISIWKQHRILAVTHGHTFPPWI